MAVLYITSVSQKVGKTMFCAGLGKHWQDSGKKPGYLKLAAVGQTAGVDKDSVFLQKVLALTESMEVLNPALNTQNAQDIQTALAAVTANKDLVIVEGLPLKDSAGIIEALDAKVLIVHDYAVGLEAHIAEYQKVGPRLLGLAVNKVPARLLERVRSQFAGQLAAAGIHFLGAVPESRILMTLCVSDLAEAVQGKMVSNPEQSGELIENFMLGSSTFDRGAAYYSRKNNKAVILWGERPGFRKAALSNLQLAALQTSIKCLVISANGVPIPAVVQKANEKQVPIISAPGTVPAAIIALENAMERLKFNQEKKMPALLGTLQQHLDLVRLANI
jgi:uncharacterized protein